MYRDKDNLKDEAIEELECGLPGDRAIRRKRKTKVYLKRALGMPGIFSIAYGNLGSSIYIMLGVTAAYALGATPLVFLFAAVFFIFTALAYAEGTAAIPEAGGSASFARQGFNELISFIAAWCLLLAYTAAIAIMSFSAISYLAYLKPFEALKVAPWNIIATGVLLGSLMVINIIGIRASSVLNVLLAGMDVATQVFIVLVGALFFFNLPKLIAQIHLGTVPTWPQLATAVYLVMISFTGIENVSNMAEESKSPETTIPRSMWMSVGLIIFLFLGMSVIALDAMPATYTVEGHVYSLAPETGTAAENSEQFKKIVYYKVIDKDSAGEPVTDAIVTIGPNRTRTDQHGFFKITNVEYGKNTLIINKSGYSFDPVTFDNSKQGQKVVNGKWSTELADQWRANPILGIANGISNKLPYFREPMGAWVSILAFTILIIATNANILGVSRLVFSMGNYMQIPPILARVSPISRTPYIAIIVFTLVAFLIIMPGDVTKMMQVYAFAAMISYTIAHISIIALRIRKPALKRPYKIPLNFKIAGREIPITSILGALASFVIWINVNIEQEYGRIIGIPFILLGIIIYAFYRRSRGFSLTETVDTEKRR